MNKRLLVLGAVGATRIKSHLNMVIKIIIYQLNRLERVVQVESKILTASNFLLFGTLIYQAFYLGFFAWWVILHYCLSSSDLFQNY